MKITFNEPDKSELRQIIHLLADDTLGNIREQYPKKLPKSYEIAFDTIKNDPNAKIIIAKYEDTIVGVAQINFIMHLTYQGGIRAQIEGVRVHKDYRSQGIGKQLFKHLILLAKGRGCHLIQLTTDKKRLEAYSFYQSMGFSNSHEGFKLHLG